MLLPRWELSAITLLTIMMTLTNSNSTTQANWYHRYAVIKIYMYMVAITIDSTHSFFSASLPVWTILLPSHDLPTMKYVIIAKMIFGIRRIVNKSRETLAMKNGRTP